MSDCTELKRVSLAIAEGSPLQGLEAEEAMHAFECAATPDVVLALIAENEELGRYLCTCRDCGGEGALHTGDWKSYGHMEPPEPVMEKCGECDGTGLLGEIQDLYQVITERDQLKAENEALRNADEWIKCSEKLPDLDEEVLAVDQYGDIDVGHYFSGYMGKLCFSSNKEISMPTHWKKFIGLPERTGT